MNKKRDFWENRDEEDFWDNYKEPLSESSSDESNLGDYSLDESSSEKCNLGVDEIQGKNRGIIRGLNRVTSWFGTMM